MAHAQKPDLVFQRNGRVHLNRRGNQFSRLLAADVCASAVVVVVMLDTPCSKVEWKTTGYPLHSPVSPSLPLPCVTCAIRFQLSSTVTYRSADALEHSIGAIISFTNFWISEAILLFCSTVTVKYHFYAVSCLFEAYQLWHCALFDFLTIHGSSCKLWWQWAPWHTLGDQNEDKIWNEAEGIKRKSHTYTNVNKDV